VEVVVSRVVDGDTLDVVMDGTLARTRLIGIDAPEHGEAACGDLAEEHLAALAPARSRLRLEFDGECRDAYGRDLVYAFIDETLVNASMVGDGYAQACPFAPNTAFAATLRCLEERAAARNKGLWAMGCLRDGCFER